MNLLKEVGVGLIDHARKAWIYHRGNYFLYPFQMNTSHLPFPRRLWCVSGYLFRRNILPPRNYQEWLIQNFGKGLAQTFMIPYARKFWLISPEEMTFEWVGNRVPRPKTIDIIRGMFRDQDTKLGTHSVFQYPNREGGGFAEIAQAFANRIKGLHCGMKATKINPYRKIIVFNDGEVTVHYDKLITTIPLPEFFAMFPEISDEIRAEVKKLAWNSIAAVNIGIARSNVSDRHWIHFPDGGISFFRVSFPSNFSQGLYPMGSSSIQAEISYDSKFPPERGRLIDRVIHDLIKVRILKSDDRIIFTDVLFIKYGYVIYNHLREEAVRRLHEYLRKFDIYPCGRYGAWAYFWSDEAVLSGKDAAERALGRTIVEKKSDKPCE